MANDVFVNLPGGRWHIDKIVAKLQQDIAALNMAQCRLVYLIEDMAKLDKTRGKAFKVLSERVKRLEQMMQLLSEEEVPG